MTVAQCERSTSSVKGTSSFRYGMASSSLRKPRSGELIPPSEGWMCEGDEEKEIGGMEPSVKKEMSSEENPEEEDDPEEEEERSEEEEDPEERISALPSLPMDIDAEEDYLWYTNELERRPEHSPLCSNQASVPDVPTEAFDRLSDGHNASSYELSGVWPNHRLARVLRVPRPLNQRMLQLKIVGLNSGPNNTTAIADSSRSNVISEGSPLIIM
ncbi:hypothetical protein PIB30_086976 [Stylosanthes scabra]|uniref:Uncharacterized protein n=1 Tax=Stylosanthes scabra TaxID=79078 RepID=A0ABU6UTI2_9FABA|nr:hypothetical protein [Stylosanthes scabra]